jgi:acylglycerol lipase
MSLDITIKHARLPNGLLYHYQHWVPRDPVGLVVYVHGLGDHIGRYGLLVDHLVRQGLACALYDQRGHGRTEGKRGHIDRFMDWVDDLASFVHFSASIMPSELPLFIIGQSLGGLIAVNYLLMHAAPVAGMVGIAPAFEPLVRIPEWRVKLYLRLARLLPELSIDNGVLFEDLSRDPAALEALAADPLFHRRLSLWAGTELMRTFELVPGYPHRIHTPMLLLTGTDDRIVDSQGALRFARGLASLDKEHRSYPGMMHDLLHDVGKEQVLEDIAGWIRQRAQHGLPRDPQYHLQRRESIWEDVSRPSP